MRWKEILSEREKSKVVVVGREGVALQAEVEMNVYHGVCVLFQVFKNGSKNGRQQEHVHIKLSEGQTPLVLWR